MATASTDVVPVDQIETLLTCAICIETLNEPRTLPCFHSFCKICLEKFVKQHRQDAGEKKIEEFNCPTCRSVFILKTNEEVAGMPSSYFIRNMLDVMAIQRRANLSKCSVCQENAISRCTTCEMFICEQCCSSHDKWPANKKHIVLSISELTQAENQAKIRAKLHCNKHENKSLKFYCETCQELICRYCMDFNHVRPDHQCFPLAEVAKKQKEVLGSRCTTLEECLKGGNETLKMVSNVKQSLKDNAENAKKQIMKQQQEVLKVFTQKLEDRTKVLINEVDEKFQETLEPLEKQETKVKDYVDKVKGSFNLGKNLLEKGNNEEIVSSQKMIEENVEKLKGERPQSMKPVHDGSLQYENCPINHEDVETILDKLGKVVCPPSAIPVELCNISAILNGYLEYGKQLKEWLGDKVQWQLCYRASRDGWRGTDFHRCCDNVGPTVTIVQVNDYIFGGYTDQSWAGKGYKWSNSSFLFSVENKDGLPPFIAAIERSNCAIYSDPCHGPTFGGGHDFHISADSTKSYSNLGHSYRLPAGCVYYRYNTIKSQSLLAGSYFFKPTEIEVLISTHQMF